MFGTMPGELAALSTFGAKLISVFADTDRPGRTRHQGVVVAYDGETGAVSCIADAEPVTKIRTACATAAATDALARADAEVLAIFGTGLQAESHCAQCRWCGHFARSCCGDNRSKGPASSPSG